MQPPLRLGSLFAVVFLVLFPMDSASMSLSDVQAFHQYAAASVEIKSAVVVDGTLIYQRSVRNYDKKKRVTYLCSPQFPPMELPDDHLCRVYSDEKDKLAVFRKYDDSTTLVEIWHGQALVRKLTVPHKLVVELGEPRWHKQLLVLVVERKLPETTSFFDENPEDKVVGAQFTLGTGVNEHWGEQLHDVSPMSNLVVLDTETGRNSIVSNVPGFGDFVGGFTLSDPVFAPDGSSLVYVAWDAGGGGRMPRRLGLTYCQQRPSSLYSSPIGSLLENLCGVESLTDETFVCVSSPNQLARSPRFSPDGKILVFLSSKDGFDTHSGCLSLSKRKWPFMERDSCREVVSQVADPQVSPEAWGTVLGLRFPGLFLQSLPRDPFDGPDSLLLTTLWGSCTKAIRVSIDAGSISLLSTDSTSSDVMLCVESRDSFVLSQTSNTPGTIHRLKEDGTRAYVTSPPPIAGSKVGPVHHIEEAPFDCTIVHLHDVPSINGVPDSTLQSVLLLPGTSIPPPLIVVPHGGPHSASTTTFIPSYAFLAGHGGYAILMVNYRGSIGFGQSLVDALPTRCGRLDVEDVVAATRNVMASGMVDPERVGICGGSHGGFLTAHCTAQYPDLFRVAATRNPVVNIASMVTTTDIPDWCHVEATGKYNWEVYRPPSIQDMDAMANASPIARVTDVKAPTLVALGLRDLRVPPSQGMEWFYSLRSLGVPCKLLLYPDDNHAISGVAAEADHWINVKQWFDTYMGPSSLTPDIH